MSVAGCKLKIVPSKETATQMRLLATCWTTAGNAYPVDGFDVSPLPLEDRIARAGAAGFSGFGVMHKDLAKYLERNTLKDLRRCFEENGIRYVELEFLTHWWIEPLPAEAEQVLELLKSSSATLKPHHVKIGPDIEGGPIEMDSWAQRLRRLGDEFEAVGTDVALEFMPFANVPDLSTALELIQAADHPSVGIMIDTWHIELGSTSYDEIAQLRPEVIKGVEINDGIHALGSSYEATIHSRRLCGEGDFDLGEFFHALRRTGWSGPIGVEILAEDYRKLPLEEAVVAAYQSALAALQEHGYE